MNQEIQNNFIVEPFKASLIMGKILNFYKKITPKKARNSRMMLLF